MKTNIEKKYYTKNDIKDFLLNTDNNSQKNLFREALLTKIRTTGNKVYLRGLIEASNICSKNCYYCGIRRSNQNTERYILCESDIINAAVYAWKNNFGSVVIQTGERNDRGFSIFIENILHEINQKTNSELGITLSCGEQSEETYKRWFNQGAIRYLLRIESSDEKLYYKLHPKDDKHSFKNRLKCLEILKKLGYQTGTGVMIGLPFQTIDNLVDDLFFFMEYDMDMIGMGPYIEHQDTPLSKYKNVLIPESERYKLSLRMIASLRMLMPDINIASTTALETLNPGGRISALNAGANVFMPNLTPETNAKAYNIYRNKPFLNGKIIENINSINTQLSKLGQEIGYSEQGNSMHYKKR